MHLSCCSQEHMTSQPRASQPYCTTSACHSCPPMAICVSSPRECPCLALPCALWCPGCFSAEYSGPTPTLMSSLVCADLLILGTGLKSQPIIPELQRWLIGLGMSYEASDTVSEDPLSSKQSSMPATCMLLPIAQTRAGSQQISSPAPPACLQQIRHSPAPPAWFLLWCFIMLIL